MFNCWLTDEELPQYEVIEDNSIPIQGYRLANGKIHASENSGAMYGSFALFELERLGVSINDIDTLSVPKSKYRILNHWDNPDGSVERGYAGNSLFWHKGTLNFNTKRVEQYAKILASIGINGICINNVNLKPAHRLLLTEELLPDLARLAAIFRKWHIHLIIAVDFASPKTLAGLNSADPLEPSVADWWRDTANLVYSYIPDLLGFLVKADSEFQAGPAALGRTQADGANALAKALQPHGGIVFWRCFVYNCTQDWRDEKTDRACAAYNEFFPLDGNFAPNVILQIKNGPVDFQVDEPPHPLLLSVPKTRKGIELQITQEYTGQQIDVCYLADLWKECYSRLDSANGEFSETNFDAVIGVSSFGDDKFWSGNPLAQANMYAFGKLAWNHLESAKDILSNWLKLTYKGINSRNAAKQILEQSYETYRKYNAPLGIGWMCTPGYHYGPNIDGYEYSQWGTYHKANQYGIGRDRTSNGTGFSLQYPPYLREMWENPETTPDRYKLFFHRLPWDYPINGTTLAQYIYTSRFEAVRTIEKWIDIWRQKSVQSELPADVYDTILERLMRQLSNAIEWRDQLNTYIFRLTGIPHNGEGTIYA